MLEKLNKKSIKYKLRKNTIENLKKTLGLKGEGTKDSPVIIDDLGDVNVDISLRTKSTYLVLRNLTISKLSIIDSQNITVEACFINDLELAVCRNITFNGNTIVSIRQLLCRDCIFENNGIIQKEYSKLINNTHEKRSFVYIWICLGVGMLYTFFSVFSLIYLYLSLDSIIFLVTGILLSIAMVYMLNLRYKLKGAPKNKYVTFTIHEKETFISQYRK